MSENKYFILAILVVAAFFGSFVWWETRGSATCTDTVLIFEHRDAKMSLSCPRADQAMTLDSERGFWERGSRYIVTCTCPTSDVTPSPSTRSPSSEL